MKSKSTAMLLAWFLGGFGGQYAYLGQTKKFVLCLLFFWTMIPACVALYHVFKRAGMSEAKWRATYVKK